MKYCTFCNRELEFSNFYIKKNKLTNYCRDCNRSKEKIRYNQNMLNPDYVKKKRIRDNRNRIKYFYGVTKEDLNKMLVSQGNKCANLACGVEISLTAPKELVKPAVVDHSHVTGKIRALLCNRCNVVLGHHEKNPKLLEGLSDYLKNFQTNS